MKKIMTKFFYLSLAMSLFFITFLITPMQVKGETLGDLKEKLNKKIEEYEKNQNQKEQTSEEIEETKKEINEIHNIIDQNRNTIAELEKEIIKLNDEIVKKEAEIKQIVKFYQVSEGTETYLEYIFGASNFTDLIYRLAVSEQMIDYNGKLVEEYNQIVDDSKLKQEQLANKEIELKNKQKELENKLDSLGDKLLDFVDAGLSFEEQIKAQRQAIKLYEEQYGCKDNDEISVCTTKKLPADTSFWRPLVEGSRTSEYGYRIHPVTGKVQSVHTGIDLAVYDNGKVPVYASAAGVVISIVKKSSCGGNQIYLHHNINGKTYTTGYLHLREMMVKVGDVVTKDTQIATMGGNPRKETWDKCTTGAHLHFLVANGLYLKDYSSYSQLVSHTVNPRSIVNFPSGGNRFYNRSTQY